MSKSLQISFDGVYYNQADLSASGNDPTTLELSPPVVCTTVRIEVLSTHSSNDNGLSSVQLFRTVTAPNGLSANYTRKNYLSLDYLSCRWLDCSLGDDGLLVLDFFVLER